MNRSPLALRPYIEIIEEFCRSLDRDSLQQCLLALAKQVKPEDRQVFLQNLRSILPANEHREVAASMIEETFLLNEMESIRKEIGNRLASLADASDWHDSGDDDRLQARSDKDPELLN